jgi:hypothetical protein
VADVAGQAKVNDPAFSVTIDQNVRRFHVPVQNTLTMGMFERFRRIFHNLGH